MKLSKYENLAFFTPFIRKMAVLGFIFLLSGCDFEFPLTGKVQRVDPTLAGEWRVGKNDKETIEVRAAVNGYQIRYFRNNGTYFFDKAVILNINGQNILQAHLYSLENSDGKRGNPKKPFLLYAFERKGDTVILQKPNSEFMKLEFKSAQQFKAAFVVAMRQDDFFGSPVTYRKAGYQKKLEGKVGNWHVQRKEDSFTDKIEHWAKLKSSSGTKATLQLECGDNNQPVEIWFTWPRLLEDLFPRGEMQAVRIDIRFDKNKAYELAFIPVKNWKDIVSIPPNKVDFWKLGVGLVAIMDPSLKRLHFGYSKWLLNSIAGSKKILARVYGRDGNSMTATFDLNGSNKVVRHLKKVCAY